MIPTLSILTPAVPSRIAQLDGLMKKLATQIQDLPVEHLVFIDNKRRTVGEKRDALLRAAKGDYVAFVDDDDDVSNNYVEELLNAINYSNPKPDVITFLQQATVNNQTAIIEFGLGNPNEPFVASNVAAPLSRGEDTATERRVYIKRNAWHVCAWRRSLAIESKFPPVNYGEDWAYAAPLCQLASSRAKSRDPVEIHIPLVLHYYRHSSQTTEAPPGS